MKNGGSKKERDFLSRNIVRYKGEDTLVRYIHKKIFIAPAGVGDEIF